VIVAVLAGLAYLPFAGLPLPFARLNTYQDYGAWLAGALTPVLVAVALLSWWVQKAGQDEANRIQAQTLILTNVHELYGRINYMSCCVIGARHPEPGTLRAGNLQEVERLTRLLRNRGAKEQTETHASPAVQYDEMIRSHFFKQLSKDLQRTTDLIETADLKFLIDERIFELHAAMKQP
jgi:hypothetical protein